MNPVDKALKTYIDCIERDFKHINDVSRKAVLVNIKSYAEGIIRTINSSLARTNGSSSSEAKKAYEREISVNSILNIDALQEIEPEISRSFHAQKPEITAVSAFACQNSQCGVSLEGMRKGTKFCSKRCNNLNRKQC